MRGWINSNSLRANNHWQSNKRGNYFPLRPWEWAGGYVILNEKEAFSKYQVQTYGIEGSSPVLKIKNPLFPFSTADPDPIKTITLPGAGTYSFKIDISLIKKPDFLKDVPLYYTGIRIGKRISGTSIKRGFISDIADNSTQLWSNKIEQVNARVASTGIWSGTDTFTYPENGFVPADSDIKKVDAAPLNKPLSIIFKVTLTDFFDVYFYLKTWIDYKYTSVIQGAGEMPVSDAFYYYGYGASYSARYIELVRKVYTSGTKKDWYKNLTTDEKNELFKLSDLELKVNFKQIETEEYNKYAEEYGSIT